MTMPSEAFVADRHGIVMAGIAWPSVSTASPGSKSMNSERLEKRYEHYGFAVGGKSRDGRPYIMRQPRKVTP